MSYSQFAVFNITGGLLWVGLCTAAGYAFGNLPWVKDNFSVVVLGIVVVSVLPIAWGLWKERRLRMLPNSVE